MLVRGNLYPIARTAKASKQEKKEVVFINSYYGKVDSDGLYSETSTVSCWVPAAVADILRTGMKLDGLLDIMGEIIMLREFMVNGKTYIVSDKGQAELKPEEPLPFSEPETGKKGSINRV